MADWRAAWKHLDRLPEIAACLRRCQRPLGLIAEYLRLRPFGRVREVRLRRGGPAVGVESYEDLATAWVVFFRREYRIPLGAETILDLGANIGCFTLLAALERPRAHLVSLEPFPPTFARLVETIRRNGLGDRVRAVPLGVGARSGERVIPASTAPSQSLGMLPADAARAAGSTAIGVQSFDELIERASADLSVEEIDFVKMDVEGAEHEAIAAASPAALRRVRALAMEYHPNGDKATLFGKLRDVGLRLTHDRVIGPRAGVAHFTRK